MLRRSISISLLTIVIAAHGQTIRQIDTIFAQNRNGDEARTALAAAKDGNHLAQFHIGTIYQTGYAGAPDYEQAVYWFRRSSESNYAKAQHALSELYLLGRGVPRDFAESARLERLAAAQGYVDAQFGLGTLYQRGYGVEKDIVRAYAWYELAANNVQERQHPFASKVRDDIAKQLTPDQLGEAKALAFKCSTEKSQECK